MSDISILIIDDEVNLTRSLAFTLKHENIDCLEAHDGASGIMLAEEKHPDIILLDVRLPDESGLNILDDLLAKVPHTPIIMISAYGDTKDAVTAIKKGAADYLTKPFDVDELTMLIRENISRKHIETEVRYLREKSVSEQSFIGDSYVIGELRTQVARVANSSVKTVLLLGETGVGKAVVAREIHNLREGIKSPFVEINCASLPEHLMEAELFGAEKGAYTGATARRSGLIEIAETGTLFLDEIGELEQGLQAKLLTFLESWTYRSIGSPREKRADVRVIAATNRDLETAVKNGTFRQDLFFRLNVMPIQIPKLADRGNDIWLLANYFAEYFAQKEGCDPISFPSATREKLESYNWPGNVRELKNLVERLTILYPERIVSESQLPLEIRSMERENQGSITESLENAEKKLVLQALRDANGKKGMAAEKLGISRHALKRRIQRLGIE